MGIIDKSILFGILIKKRDPGITKTRPLFPVLLCQIQTEFRVAESTIRVHNYESAGIINEHFLQDYGNLVQTLVDARSVYRCHKSLIINSLGNSSRICVNIVYTQKPRHDAGAGLH